MSDGLVSSFDPTLVVDEVKHSPLWLSRSPLQPKFWSIRIMERQGDSIARRSPDNWVIEGVSRALLCCGTGICRADIGLDIEQMNLLLL